MRDLRERFIDSVLGGTGEAVLILRRSPDLDVAEDIWKACITNHAFDRQAESRHDYAWLLIQQHSRRQELCDKVIRAVRHGRTPAWQLDHLVPIVALIASEGSEQARQALYVRFEKAADPSVEVFGDLEIAHLDGLNGFLRIARVLGERLLKDPTSEFNEHSFYHGWGDMEGSVVKQGWRELKKIARKEPAVRAYVQRSHPPGRITKHVDGRGVHSYRSLKMKLEGGQRILFLNERYVTQGTVKRLCEDFLNESDPRKLERYIRLLQPVRMIGARAKLLALLDEGRVDRHLLCSALSRFQGKDLRSLALKELKNDSAPEDYLLLLRRTYEQGDANLIKKLARQAPYPRSHALLQSALSVYRNNTVEECRGPLEVFYDRTNCGLCRHELIRLLDKNGVLSRRILGEMEFDSNEDTRTLHRRILRRQTLSVSK